MGNYRKVISHLMFVCLLAFFPGNAACAFQESGIPQESVDSQEAGSSQESGVSRGLDSSQKSGASQGSDRVKLSDAINIHFPTDYPFLLFDDESGGRQLTSQIFYIANYGSEDVVIDLSDIWMEPADEVVSHELSEPADSGYQSDTKDVFAFLKVVKQDTVPDEETIHSIDIPMEKVSPQKGDYILTGANRTKGYKVTLEGAKYNKEGEFVSFRQGSVFAFYIAGSVTPNKNLTWKRGDLKIEITAKFQSAEEAAKEGTEDVSKDETNLKEPENPEDAQAVADEPKSIELPPKKDGEEVPRQPFFALFGLRDRYYAVDSKEVTAMTQIPEIEELPNAPKHILGVFRQREKMVPVLSLRSLFGMPSLDDEVRQFQNEVDLQKQKLAEWSKEFVRYAGRDTYILPDDIGQCSLGAWCNSYESGDAALNRQFQEIEEFHRQLHALAKELKECFELEEGEALENKKESLLKQQEEYTVQISDALESLKEIFAKSKKPSLYVIKNENDTAPFAIAVDKVLPTEQLTALASKDQAGQPTKDLYTRELRKSPELDAVIPVLDSAKLALVVQDR